MRQAALDKIDADFFDVVYTLGFYAQVHPDEAVRNAANEAEVLHRQYKVEADARVDVFRVKQAAVKSIEHSGEELGPEEKRLVEKSMLDGKQNGLDLDEEKRSELKELKKELEASKSEFMKNANEEKGYLTFSNEELDGLPEDVIAGYEKVDGGMHKVSFQTVDKDPIMMFAKDSDVRKRMFEASEGCLQQNVPILERILDLRTRIAKLVGYKTWADYSTATKMAKNGQAVEDFLADLETRLRPLGEKEIAETLAVKKQMCAEQNTPFDEHVYSHERGYLGQLRVEKKLSFDSKVVREYFPVDHVVKTTFEIYQNLFEVEFVKVEDTLWHKDVQQYAMWRKDAKDEQGFLGWCYIDIYARPGKNTSAACMPFINGHAHGGQIHYPAAAMVAGLSKATPDTPALMRHFDVVLFFHEMGHIFHHLFSRTRFARFHGTNVTDDFCEAPSQMLEQWMWEPRVLKKMAVHYETGEPMSDELIGKLLKSRYASSGLFYLFQVFLAKYSLVVHLDRDVGDLTKLWCDMRDDLTGYKTISYQPGQCGLPHLIGYDVAYYGYNYSLVFAADMYATVFKRDPFDIEAAQHYIKEILVPGAARDEAESVEAFLGRPVNSEAFLKQILGGAFDANATVAGPV